MKRDDGTREAQRQAIRRALQEAFPEWSGRVPELPEPVTVVLKNGRSPLDLILDRRLGRG